MSDNIAHESLEAIDIERATFALEARWRSLAPLTICVYVTFRSHKPRTKEIPDRHLILPRGIARTEAAVRSFDLCCGTI